jgi:hypothetical protein
MTILPRGFPGPTPQRTLPGTRGPARARKGAGIELAAGGRAQDGGRLPLAS